MSKLQFQPISENAWLKRSSSDSSVTQVGFVLFFCLTPCWFFLKSLYNILFFCINCPSRIHTINVKLPNVSLYYLYYEQFSGFGFPRITRITISYYILDFVNMSRLGLLLVLHLPHRFLDLEGEFSGLLYSPWM